MNMVETVAPELAVWQVLSAGFRKHVPAISERVEDEDFLLERHKQSEGGGVSRSGNLSYPFISIRDDSEELIGVVPAPVKWQKVSSPSLDTTEDPGNPGNPLFDGDVVELTDTPSVHRFGVTIYSEATPDGKVKLYQAKHQVFTYLNLIADEEIDPATYAIDGLSLTWYDPTTGLIVADQENPPVGSVMLEGRIHSFTGTRNETTKLNESVTELRLAFTLEVGVDHIYQRVVPDVQRVTVDPFAPEAPTGYEEATIPVTFNDGIVDS